MPVPIRRGAAKLLPYTLAVILLACRTAAPVRQQPERFLEVDRILDEAIADGAFPGAVIAVGHRGRFVHLAAHGRQTYAADSPRVEIDTVYDIASLTNLCRCGTYPRIRRAMRRAAALLREDSAA